MKTYIVDVETYSAEPITHGAAKYAAHPSTEVLVLCWMDPETAEIHTIHNPRRLPAELLDATLVAHNAGFEEAIFRYVLKTEISWHRWDCTAARARAVGLPGSLGALSAVLNNTEEQKDKRGAELIRKLCMPQKDGSRNRDPALLQELAEYCAQDVRATAAVHRKLPALSAAEAAVWRTDAAVNARGVRIDEFFARTARARDLLAAERVDKDCRALTEGVGTTQTKKLQEWLAARGVRMQDLRRERVLRALQSPRLPADARRVLELREEGSRTSGKKYHTLLARMLDGRVHGAFVYAGAHTGRWTSRGAQFHNFSSGWRSEQSLEDAYRAVHSDAPLPRVRQSIGELVRCSVVGDPLLAIGDYRGIELRLSLAAVGARTLVDRLVAGEDLYRVMAALVYSTRADQVSALQREIGKRMVLGLGYGLGHLGFSRQLYEAYRVRYTPELCYPVLGGETQARSAVEEVRARMKKEPAYAVYTGVSPKDDERLLGIVFCRELVRRYREENHRIVDAWQRLEDSAVACATRDCDVAPVAGGGTMYRTKRALVLRLLSGRTIRYWNPRFRAARDPITGKPMPDRKELVYTDHSRGVTHGLFGGKLFSHLIQGTARDVLADALVHLELHTNYTPVLHVHDEIVSETDDPDPEPYRRALLAAAQDHRWSRLLPLDASVSVSPFWSPKA